MLLHYAKICDDHLPVAEKALQERDEVPQANRFLGIYSLLFYGLSAHYLGLCNAYEGVTKRHQAALQPSDVEKKAVLDVRGQVQALLYWCQELHELQKEVVGKGGPSERCSEIMSNIDRLVWDLYYATDTDL